MMVMFSVSSLLDVYKAKLKDENDAPSSGGLKRSHSSPNIAKMMQDEEAEKAAFTRPAPSMDRSAKPQPR